MVIHLPQGMRVIMVDTTDGGELIGPNGSIGMVKRLGIDGDRVRYRDGDGPMEPFSAIYRRQLSSWPGVICGILALAPFFLYLKNRLMAPRVTSISSSV